MSPEKQRRAIAEACGWKLHKEPFQIKWIPPNGSYWYPWQRTEEKAWEYAVNRMGLPDYLSDRSATVAALMTLTPAQQVEFGERIANAIGYDDDIYDGWNIGANAFFEALTAPLDKVAKCFLQTIHKWEGK